MLSRVLPAPVSVSEFYFFGPIVPLKNFTFCPLAPGMSHMTHLTPGVTHRTQDYQDLHQENQAEIMKFYDSSI